MQQQIENARRWRAALKLVTTMVLAGALVAILVLAGGRG